LSFIEYPVETIYLLWQASRTNDPLRSPAELRKLAASTPDLAGEIDQTFRQVIESDIPVAENLDFIFVLDNIPISLREQIVRHRVGHHFGENFAVDIIPGENRSSWWSQSMRVMDMGQFAAHGEYYMPDSFRQKKLIPRRPTDGPAELALDGAMAEGVYDGFMRTAGELYTKFVEAGIPPEDARQIIPLAACHRISWKLNYMSLKHILGRRGCWIAQLGMWKPIILDMVEELATQIHPIFRSLVRPPCLNHRGQFTACPFIKDNLLRLAGKDPEPPCAAFLHHHDEDTKVVPKEERVFHPAGRGTWDATEPARRQRYKDLMADFSKLWGRSAYLLAEESK
jgi:thymidylate synthase ThyX